MPKFLDVHPLKGFDEETLKSYKIRRQMSSELNILMYNQKEDRFYYLIDAPNR
jgi:hypothetical protein